MEEENNVKDIIAEANVAAKRLEEANKVHKELLDREEKLRATEILSGKALAGQTPEKPVEETPKEYADRILRGGI